MLGVVRGHYVSFTRIKGNLSQRKEMVKSEASQLRDERFMKGRQVGSGDD